MASIRCAGIIGGTVAAVVSAAAAMCRRLGRTAKRCAAVGGWVGVACSLAASAPAAQGAIHLELRPESATVNVGDTLQLGLYAVSDNLATQYLSAANVILMWNTTYLNLTGLSSSGAVPLLLSAFGAEPYGLNASLSDGDGMWLGYAHLGNPVGATSAGTLLTTILFHASAVTPTNTMVTIPLLAGNPVGKTTVFDGFVENLDVTGNLSGATITIVPAPGAMLVVLAGAFSGGRRRR